MWRSLWLFAFSLLGIYGSFMLIASELNILSNPDAILACDINPLVGCSDSLLAPQAHLFSISNSVIGLAAFVALAAFSAVLATGARLPKWMWWALAAGVTVGFFYVLYFLYLSLTVFAALCPYCMLTWVATVAAFVIVWANVFAQGMVGQKQIATGKAVGRYWALVALGTLLIFVLIIVIVLRSQVAALF